MLLKLAALGAIGYVGYKYLEKNGGLSQLTGPGTSDRSDPHLAVAGGPLSEGATLVHAGEPMPT
jgi:hypothetical protein